MAEYDRDGIGLGGVQMAGVVNSLKTGNVMLDMAIAMTIPLVLKFAFGAVGTIHRIALNYDWTEWWRRRKNIHERVITYRSIQSMYGSRTSLDEDSHNDVLIRAVQLYLHEKGLLTLQSADMSLTATGNKGSLDSGRSYFGYDSDDDGDSKTFAGMLSGLQIMKNPQGNTWHDVGAFGTKGDPKSFHPVNIMFTDDEDNVEGKENNTKTTCTTTLSLRSQGESSIDAFVDTAYEWFVGEMKKQDDKSRYMYEVISDGDDYDYHHRTYKRYKLSEEKTFESLFFREKDDLLQIIDHFTEKSGRYAIKGYPHKFGLLLHGPPGTGKTSLIKALAQKTERSIINVPLAKISTNSELMSLFFDGKYDVQGESVPFKLGFDDVIFVLEDVDAASSIVRRRDGKKTADVTYTEHAKLPPPKTLWRLFLESSNESCRELVPELMEKSSRLKEDAVKILPTLARRPLQTVPGLSVFCEGQSNSDKSSELLDRISQEAVNTVENIMGNCGTVDEYLGQYAGTIKAILDAGVDVSPELEDALLGISDANDSNDNGISLFRPKPGTISRDVSYKKYPEDNSLHMEISSMLSAQGDKKGGQKTNEGDTASTNLAAMIKSSASSGPSMNLSPLLKQEYLKGAKDKLNLSGLLNVLDGVVDTPGRMVIMTSNHPEMLDPALIRPGRIDKKMMLGYMHPTDVAEMIEHYFQETLSPQQRVRIEAAVNGGGHRPAVKLTPAQVEQYACEWTFAEEMIRAIEKKGKPVDTEKAHISSGTVTFDS
mmetsp:Transcript_7602/g.16561  ORF Transcript_7602/g.16561 Transcript_7602/m.16561 type:complete len:767 (-) Transcript_7602:145-2445(-)|eukprot:CAMPEP_0183732504 /NCGR_PEP_ID=MMETSP0737-20130205/38641_1 /TAXON_ID=385413 /ORGANISM="Thalassiosira miniscula, Strain CCMP1093" /LENGTH=766 /DNA_ID=CAMNT_0025965533 /DNA_START=36 /DNA_END=2336 /DNA_ORIENTATION=+